MLAKNIMKKYQQFIVNSLIDEAPDISFIEEILEDDLFIEVSNLYSMMLDDYLSKQIGDVYTNLETKKNALRAFYNVINIEE